MNTNELGLPEYYSLEPYQTRDTYAAVYLDGTRYAVVLSATGQTVGRLSLHPSGAWTAVSLDGRRLLIGGERMYSGDLIPRRVANLAVWPNP